MSEKNSVCNLDVHKRFKSKKAESHMTKSLMVFLILIFVMLGLYIAVWISNVYKGTTEYTEKGGKTVIECISYAFEISDLKYSNNQLSFIFENSAHSDLDVQGLEIRSGNKTAEYNETVKISRKVRVTTIMKGLNSTANFSISPRGCLAYAKKCSLKGCERLEDLERSNSTDFFE